MYLQVQYHTFPTIEDTLFRQDLTGKGKKNIYKINNVSLHLFLVPFIHNYLQG